MPDKNTLTQEVYNYYNSSRPGKVSSFENFQKGMNEDEGKRRAVYDILRREGALDDTWNYEDFTASLSDEYNPQQPEPQPQQPAPQSQAKPSVGQAKRQALAEKTKAQSQAQTQRNFNSFMQAVNQGFGAPQEEPEPINIPELSTKQKAERAKVEAQERAQAEAIPEGERLTEAEKAYYTANTGDMLRGVQGAEFDFERNAERVKSDTSLPVYTQQEAVEIRRQKDKADKEISEAMGGLPVKDGNVNYGELNKWANDVLSKFGYDEAEIKSYSGFESNSPTGLTRENLHYNIARGKVSGVFNSDEDADIRKDEIRAYDAALALEKFSRRAKQEEEVLKGERGSFVQGLTEGTITDMITDLISDAPTLLKIADRVEKGEKLLPIEDKLIATYVSSSQLQASLQDTDRWYRYGKTGRGLAEFLMSMMATGGIGGIVKTGTSAAAKTSQYVAKRLTWDGAKSAIRAKTAQLPGIFVSELIRQPFMFTKQREYAQNMIGLYDFGYDDNKGKFTVKRNDNTASGAFLKPTAEGAVMNTVFRFWGLMDDAMMQWIGKSKLLSKTAGDVIKESGNITGNSVWSKVGSQLNKIGATHIPTMFVQMPTADLLSAASVGDWDKIKSMGTGRYWGDLTAASIMIGGGRTIASLAARPLAAAREYRQRMQDYNSAIDSMEKMQFGSERVKGFLTRSVDIFRQDAMGGKDFSGQRLKIRALGKEMADSYRKVEEELNEAMEAYRKGDTSLEGKVRRLSEEVEEYKTLGEVISNMEVQSLYAKGMTEGMDVVLQDKIGEFENRTAKGGYVTIVQSRADGKTYFLLDNKGDVSIVRGMSKDAEPFDMKTGDYNVLSSIPKEEYLGRAATMGLELGNMIEANRGARDAVIQQYNRDNFSGDTRPTTYTPRGYDFEQKAFYNGRPVTTRSAIFDDGEVLIEDEDGNRIWVKADELTSETGAPFTSRAESSGGAISERVGLPEPELPLELESGERVAPAERVEAPASESPVSLEGTAALREGDTAYLGEEPVVVRAISEDGQTAMIEIGGDMMEVSTADLNPAAPAVEEGTMPSESTADGVPATETVQSDTGESAVLPDESQPSVTPEPQPEEERPPLPTQKNGEVDYNTLLEQDPARFIEEWDKVEGPGAGVEAIMGARESVNSQIEKIQKTLEKPSADFNKRAADRKKLQELQAKKEAMDRAIAPYEQAVDVVDEMVANGDIPGLGEQSVPTSTEAPAPVEAPAPAEEIVSVEDVEIPENNSANSQDLQPVGTGDFGEIYDQFRGDAQGAIAFLMQKRGGEALGALSHKDVGDIALVYGNEKSGLRKIAEKHPEVLDKLQDILNDMEIVSESDNRIKLESDGYYAVISKDYFGKKRDAWLLTAFEKKNSASDNTMDTVGTLTGEGNDTATSQDTVSGNKDNTHSSNIQTSGEENSQPVEESPKPQPVKETPAAYTITVGGRVQDSPMEIKVADQTLQSKLEAAVDKADNKSEEEQNWVTPNYSEAGEIYRQYREKYGDVEDMAKVREAAIKGYREWLNEKIEENKRVYGIDVPEDFFDMEAANKAFDAVVAQWVGGKIIKPQAGQYWGTDYAMKKAAEESIDKYVKAKTKEQIAKAKKGKMEVSPDTPENNAIREEIKKKEKKKFNPYNYVDVTKKGQPLRPVMETVFHDKKNGGWAVASDAHILIASKDLYDPKLADKKIDKKGNEVNDEYPAWQKLFRGKDAQIPLNKDYVALYKGIQKIKEAKKALEAKEKGSTRNMYAYVSLGEGMAQNYYLVDNLEKFLDAAVHFGIKPSEIFSYGKNKAMGFDTPKVKALVMPARISQYGAQLFVDNEGELRTSEPYIKEALGLKEESDAPKFQKQIEPASSNPVRDAVVDVLRNKGKLKVFDDGTGQEIIDAYYRGDTEAIRGYKFFKSPDGQTIYGFEKDDTIYIDPKAPTDTPIHEYTHLWAKMFRKINPKEWANIIKLMKGTGLWEAVRKAYPELKTESDIAEEVLSHYSGKRGAERIEAEMKRIRGDKSMSASMKMKALQALHNLRMALDKFWKTIAEYLGMKFTTAEEVADRVLADIERGINPREVMKKVSESNRQVVKAREVLDYFKSKGFKNGEIIRSITDHGVSTYIYGDWGTGYLTKYRISDHGMGAFRAATEISFHQDTNPQTLYRLGAGRMAPSGEQQQQRLSEGNEIAQLWEKHEEELSGYDFQKQQTPLDLKEAIEKYPILGRAKYLQQRVNSDGKFTYEYSVPHSSGKNPQRPSLGMLRGIDSENPGGNIRTTEIREQKELSDSGIRFSKRLDPAPKKTGIGYKVFVLKDGKLYPPMVANPNGEETPVGVWLDADAAPQAGTSKTGRPQVKAGGKGTQGGSGTLAYRPGWHLGEIPYALQFGRLNPETGAKDLFPNNFVWAEVEYANDIDYQKEAEAEGINASGKYQHSLAGLKKVPVDGSYRYRTNPNPATDPWIITGAMKVNRILSREEVNDIVRKAGREPQPIQEGDILTQEIVDKINRAIKEESVFAKEKKSLNLHKSLDTPLGRKLNEAGPTKKELVAEAKRKMPDTKIVDKNGEPLVVYHDTNSKMYVNKETGENWENLDWKAKEVWRDRDDWDEHWEERDFYTFDNKGHGRESIEMPAFFFTPNPDPYHEYGERRISAFLNIKNPAINPNIENAGVTNTAGRDAMNKLIEQGYDGIIRTNDAGEIEEVAAFFPEQIKSADPITYDDNGNPIPLEDRFDSSKSDIRFSKPLEERLDKAISETDEKIEAAQATRRAKLDEINKKVKKVHKYLRDYMKKNLAQSAQRGYDKETVKAVTDLAKDLIKEKLIDTESLRGLNSLLTTISHVTGRESIKSSVMGIMNIVASNQIRNEKEYFNELLKTKGMKINSNGVKVQGRVDVFTQNYLKALNESKDMEREDIQDLYDRALDEYSKAPGDDERTRGLYAGYSGAMDYADQVRAAQSALKAKENHIEATRKQMWEDYEAHKGTEEGKQKLKVYKEFLDASRDEMLRARLNLADDFRSFNNQVATYIKIGKSEAKDFKARELEHINKIHHYANSDLKGREVSDQPNKGNIATNNPVTRVLLSSLPTFEMFMKLFGRKSTRGEGNLYKHFVHGFQSADDAEFTNLDNNLETIKKKGKEIFGRNTRLGQAAFQSERGIGIKVTWLDAGKPKEFEISQGIGAYIHAVNKMTDGKMHLRAMGITEEDVAKIESKVDEKYIRFIDWLQDEFLPELWYRFNDVHQKVFGASLSKIDHYFPLKVNKNALVKQESIDDDGTISLPSTITGNIKTRTNNVAPLDLLNSNAFSVALQYMQEMEHWAAYVPMIKDLNALISYKPFRNKVKGMVTAYGNGNQTWETFLKCCRLAAGVYHPLGSGSEFDKYTVNLSKSLAAAKIALRVYTAFKQFFSAPAYISDASPVFLAKNISNPVSWVMSWNWCYKNLPNFKKRWKSRIAGETRLLPSDKDWTMWSTKIADIASKIGLTPNAFVDALTVSIGAKSIYETRRYSYLRQGFPKDKAEAKARLDAEIAYNETQQSSGGMFVSPIQIDRTAEAFLRSTFRNASFAYERQVVQGLRNVRNMARYGQKEMVDYMTKQAVRDGADEDKARGYFKWEYKKAWVRENFRALLFGYGMQFAWYAGASMPYFFWGRDKKKIQNYLETSAINAAFGPVEGLPYGGTISSWGTKAVMGDKNAWRDPNVIGSTLLGDDVDNAIRLWGNDQMAAANETINLIVQMGIGINPQTVWDVFLAVDDAVNGDPDIEREVLLCMMRVLQVPQSQVNEIFIDEMGLPASKCSELTVNQFAKRYAEYRMKRGAYATRGGYSDAKKLDVLQKYEKQFKKYWKERIKLDEGEEAAKTKTLKQWKAEAEAALKSGDREGYETATRGLKSQKLQNAFKNARKKLNDAIQAETDPAKRAKLEDKLRKLERDEQEKTVE